MPNRMRCGHRIKAKVIREGELINVFKKFRMLHKSLEFRAKQKRLTSSCLRPIQWLFAHSISSQEKFFLLCIPEGNRKHAINFFKSATAPFFVNFQDYFCVALTLK